jgi:hypothetical protein
VLVVAFKGEKQNAVVVVNLNTVVKSQTFSFKNDTVSSVKKFVTSRSKNLNDEGTVAIAGNTFTDNLDAQSITTYITSKVITGIKSVKTDEISIYPNPASGYLQFSSTDDIEGLEVVNLLGQKFISTGKPDGSRLDISMLTPGIYLLNIRLTQGEKCFSFIKK